MTLNITGWSQQFEFQRKKKDSNLRKNKHGLLRNTHRNPREVFELSWQAWDSENISC